MGKPVLRPLQLEKPSPEPKPKLQEEKQEDYADNAYDDNPIPSIFIEIVRDVAYALCDAVPKAHSFFFMK
jgi:hypothetical protein